MGRPFATTASRDFVAPWRQMKRVAQADTAPPSSVPQSRTAERRRHPRSAVVASAIVWLSPDRSARYVAKNLSRGGVLLAGGPLLTPGRTVRIALRLRGGATVVAQAELVRANHSANP